ncbi:hypothetical protein RFI_01177, partial [Reticulomyxa filosa]
NNNNNNSNNNYNNNNNNNEDIMPHTEKVSSHGNTRLTSQKSNTFPEEDQVMAVTDSAHLITMKDLYGVINRKNRDTIVTIIDVYYRVVDDFLQQRKSNPALNFVDRAPPTFAFPKLSDKETSQNSDEPRNGRVSDVVTSMSSSRSPSPSISSTTTTATTTTATAIATATKTGTGTTSASGSTSSSASPTALAPSRWTDDAKQSAEPRAGSLRETFELSPLIKYTKKEHEGDNIALGRQEPMESWSNPQRQWHDVSQRHSEQWSGQAHEKMVKPLENMTELLMRAKTKSTPEFWESPDKDAAQDSIHHRHVPLWPHDKSASEEKTSFAKSDEDLNETILFTQAMPSSMKQQILRCKPPKKKRVAPLTCMRPLPIPDFENNFKCPLFYISVSNLQFNVESTEKKVCMVLGLEQIIVDGP